MGGLTSLSSRAANDNDPQTVGPVRLVAPTQATRPSTPDAGIEPREGQREQPLPGREGTRAVDVSEFERYVQRMVGDDVEIRRFGMK